MPRFAGSKSRGAGYSSPMFVYRWEMVRELFDKHKDREGDLHDGLLIEYIDPTNGRCGGGSYEDKTPMHSEAHGMIMRCFGEDDLYIGLPELRKLRVFFDFSEKMLYATVGDARRGRRLLGSLPACTSYRYRPSSNTALAHRRPLA